MGKKKENKELVDSSSSSSRSPNSEKEMLSILKKQILYYQQILQKTLLSLQKYKQLDIIAANDINIATQKIENIYIELDNNYFSKNKITNMIKNLNIIKNDIYKLLKSYGTENLSDLLNICLEDQYKSYTDWDENKYKLLEKFFHPINFKVIEWNKNVVINSNKVIEKNKIVEDFVIAEKSVNLDSFDLCRTSDAFNLKVYGIKIAIHNLKEKSTYIVAGIIDDLLITCLNNDFLSKKLKDIITKATSNENYNEKTTQRFIQSLSLKELLIYSTDELIKKYDGYNSQIMLIKHKPVSQIVKEFINCDLYGQRNTIIQLLLKVDEHEYQYLAYLLYDLLSNDNNGTIDTSEQTKLFDSLPWRIKNYFKDAMKKTIAYTNNLSDFDNTKIPLEQQICLMKVSDSVKEKAMTKLKEVKAKNDDNGSKARNYLDGLLKIPFGVYKKEWIFTVMNDIKEKFNLLITNVKKIDKNFSIEYKNIDNNDNLTNIEIKNTCQKIKLNYLQCSNNLIIEKIIDFYTHNQSRNNLIVNICNINNIIKKLNIKNYRLNHSGKKIDFMKDSIIKFIKDFQNNETVIKSLLNYKNVSDMTVNNSIKQDINYIENKWSDINNYMNNSRKILDDAVHGHESAKDQIEKLLGQWINGEQKGYSFGFEGPPGCGKTTFAKKGLAKCLVDEHGDSRPFTFIAIGGQDNGSSLNGHNYTYVGSEWGKFVDILMKHKCMNPIIFIDELDKVSKTENGKEIIGILTHLIDSTQNDTFQDKYFNGIDLDMSKVLFIFSYNDVSAIDRILLDRIHRIKFEHLTLEDKIVISRKHLLPELYNNMGLSSCIDLTDENIIFIIENYTNEPGIRKFKELLFEIIGEINLSLLKNSDTVQLPIRITNDEIKTKYLKDRHEKIIKCIPFNSSVGIINGLWANSMGQGGIIPIEIKYFPSSTFMELKLTGMQGDVMKESMTVAKTLATSLVNKNCMAKNIEYFEKTKMQGIHIHCPEGAVPKDGPSAGTAITSAIYSLLTNKKIKNTIAITGEINLQGNVTAIGGLDLKILGGIKGGVKEFIYPKENEKDFLDFYQKYQDKNLLQDIQFHIVENIHQVLKLIFE